MSEQDKEPQNLQIRKIRRKQVYLSADCQAERVKCSAIL